MALYKHRALIGDSLQYEWVSDDADPAKTNPYQSGYEGVAFQTLDASEKEIAAHQDSQDRKKEREKKQQAKAVFKEAIKKIADPDVAAAIKALADSL